MSSGRWMAAILTSVALAGCEDSVAPEGLTPTRYSFDVTVTDDSLTRSLIGITEILTMPNGHSEPWPRPSGQMVGTDRTVFSLIPGPSVSGLSIVLLGPFGTGDFELHHDGERIDPTARKFEAFYSIEAPAGEWRHYAIDSGTVRVGWAGERRALTFSLFADTARLVRMGAHAGVESRPIELAGRVISTQKN